MSAIALFDILQDFGKRPPRAGDAAPMRSLFETPEDEIAQAQGVPDMSELIAAEVARAEAALSERLEQEHASALAEEREQHAAEIEALTRRLGEEAAVAIAARMAELEERVAELATTATARILGNMLNEDMQRRSIESLARSIRAATAGATRIQVKGPQALFEALSAAVPELAASLDHVEEPGFELTVLVDEDIFETRISEWSTAMSEILS